MKELIAKQKELIEMQYRNLPYVVRGSREYVRLAKEISALESQDIQPSLHVCNTCTTPCKDIDSERTVCVKVQPSEKYKIKYTEDGLDYLGKDETEPEPSEGDRKSCYTCDDREECIIPCKESISQLPKSEPSEELKELDAFCEQHGINYEALTNTWTEYMKNAIESIHNEPSEGMETIEEYAYTYPASKYK